MGAGEAAGEGSGAGQWSHGLCGCFDNCMVCILSYFVPCYVWGKTAEKVGESCVLCGVLLIVPIANIVALLKIRGMVREQKGIDGSIIGDFCLFLFCSLCTIAQTGQEVWEDPSPGGMAIERA